MISSEQFTFEGMRIPVEIHRGPDRPLLYLPGFGVHPRNYRRGIEYLSRHFTVFMPDLSFRSHTELPLTVAAYRELADRLADRFAPEAPRTGHSFGGLLAMLGDQPAVALAPMIPIMAGWPRKIGRAALLQVREYLGLEGRLGIGWAFHIFAEYVRTAAIHPRCLFPAVSETLGRIPEELVATAPISTVILARRDRLYRQAEYDAYLSLADDSRIDVRYVSRGHDWPITHPRLVETELVESLGIGGEATTAARSIPR